MDSNLSLDTDLRDSDTRPCPEKSSKNSRSSSGWGIMIFKHQI